jgi:hypothetical protein
MARNKKLYDDSNYVVSEICESDEFDEEVIYSKESPKMEEFFRDFDWELDRFVEYRLPIKKILRVLKHTMYFVFLYSSRYFVRTKN